MLERTRGTDYLCIESRIKKEPEDGGTRFYRSAQLFTVLMQMSTCDLACISHYDADGRWFD